MTGSSQEQRGSGLSSSLVSDFRAILTSLEEKSSTSPSPPVARRVGPARPASVVRPELLPVAATPVSAARTKDAESEQGTQSSPARPPVSVRQVAEPEAVPQVPLEARAGATSTASPGMIEQAGAALRHEREIAAVTASQREPATTGKGKKAARSPEPAENTQRRRGFGTTVRTPGAGEGRRKRNTSSDVITWQRVGVLAVFVALVGGGVAMLQSFAAREEAQVAPEVIGNAAVASVAPSQAVPEVAPLSLAALGTSAVAQETSGPEATGSVAESVPPVLRDTASPFTIASVPAPVDEPAAVSSGVTAFAAPEASTMLAEPAVAAPEPAVLPPQTPLPPPAPVRNAGSEAEPTPSPAPAASRNATEASAPVATEGGGEPTGTVTVRNPVTMRTGPRRGAAAIVNLSPGTKVELVGCESWCEIITDGKRGFVYKSFLSLGGATGATSQARAGAPAEEQAQEPADEPAEEDAANAPPRNQERTRR